MKGAVSAMLTFFYVAAMFLEYNDIEHLLLIVFCSPYLHLRDLSVGVSVLTPDHTSPYQSIVFLTYKSTYASTSMPSNFRGSSPSFTNSFTLLSGKCGPRCLLYLAKISGFASSLLSL